MADDDFATRVKDAAYVAVGLGVLGAQRLLVGRREVTKRVEPRVRGAAAQLQRLATVADDRVNPVIDRVEERLPDATRGLVRSARGRVSEARDAVLSRAAGRSS